MPLVRATTVAFLLRHHHLRTPVIPAATSLGLVRGARFTPTVRLMATSGAADGGSPPQQQEMLLALAAKQEREDDQAVEDDVAPSSPPAPPATELSEKELRKLRKKEMKAHKRARRAGEILNLKPCDLCKRDRDLLVRCQIDGTEKWFMVCGRCWRDVSGGVVDGDAAHPHYRYGGLWKAH